MFGDIVSPGEVGEHVEHGERVGVRLQCAGVVESLQAARHAAPQARRVRRELVDGDGGRGFVVDAGRFLLADQFWNQSSVKLKGCVSEIKIIYWENID